MNSFGRIFRIQLFGESHGPMIGVILDGVPAGISLSEIDFHGDIDRRRAGRKGTTPRKESDAPMIQSGIFEGKTTGAPLMIAFENSNIRSRDYDKMKATPRPGHADFVASKKFKGFNDYRGGGHFSGRLTLCLVAAGVLAKKILKSVRIEASLMEAGGQGTNIEKAIDQALKEGDSIGGVVECRASGLPVGLGEPFFDSVESLISHLAFAIPAIKGIEFGSGFKASSMKGSEHNDAIEDAHGKTTSNNAGGINGGISNGNELVFRVAVKPTSSISKQQESYNSESGQKEVFSIHGRHDACIALRVPVVLEAITAIALADMYLLMS